MSLIAGKKIPYRIVVTTLIVLFCLTGCQGIPGMGKTPSTKSFTVYVDADLEFLVKIPPDWYLVQKTADKKEFLPATRWWRAPKGKTGLAVSIVPATMTAEAWAKLIWPGLQLVPQKKKDVEPEKIIPGFWEGTAGSFRVWVREVKTPQRKYVAVSHSPNKMSEETGPVIEAILETLAPIQPAGPPKGKQGS